MNKSTIVNLANLDKSLISLLPKKFKTDSMLAIMHINHTKRKSIKFELKPYKKHKLENIKCHIAPNLINAVYIGNFKFRLTYEQNICGLFDLKKLLNHAWYKNSTMFQPLYNEEFVKNFTISSGFLYWRDKNLDFNPEHVFEYLEVCN